MQNIVETIATAHYLATEAQVEQLAAQVATGSEGTGTYLRILVAAVQKGLNRKGRVTAKSVEALLDAKHEQFYAAVVRGVGGDSIPAPERKRKANFARSAASTLRAFVREGGDIRALDVDAVTKSRLRAAVAPAESEDRNERSLQRAENALERAARRLAKVDPEAARERVEAAIEALTTVLADLRPRHRPTQRAAAGRRTPTVAAVRH